jgi:hypothetical protein
MYWLRWAQIIGLAMSLRGIYCDSSLAGIGGSLFMLATGIREVSGRLLDASQGGGRAHPDGPGRRGG